MGTSKSYSGSGGKAGKDLRADIADWVGADPDTQKAPDAAIGDSPNPAAPDGQSPFASPFQNVIALLRPRGGGGGDGPGGGGGGGAGAGGGGSSSRSSGGPRRSAAKSASTAGRAAAAAYAYRTADAATLEKLGLNYAELVALGSPLLVTRKIVETICGPRSDSTIEESEQRLIAAEVADWVVSQESEGYVATPEDIAKHAISNIVVDTLLTEAGEILASTGNAALAEEQIREAAENWVESRATVEIDGATEEDFSGAIEAGIESLRKIIRGES